MTAPGFGIVSDMGIPDPTLSPRQEECLRLLWAYFRSHRAYPTYRELAAGMDLAASSIDGILALLEKKGVIVRAGRARRNMRVTELGVRMLRKMDVPITDGDQLGLV